MNARTDGLWGRFFTFALVACSVLFAASCTPGEPTFPVPIATGVERTWLGPEVYANRLQDWRLSDGWFEALEGRTAKPMRTAHLLSGAFHEGEGSLLASVRIAPRANAAHDSTWAGLLLGAGGDTTDYHISVLVHHWPAPDGGLVVAVDGMDRVVIRDNGHAESRTGPRRDYTIDDWPLVAVVAEAPETGLPGEIELRVRAIPYGESYRVEASVLDPGSGETLSQGVADGLPAHYFDGTIALASHGSPTGDDVGYRFKDWRVGGSKYRPHLERLFGPVMAIQYTLSRGTLKLTAQFGPLGPDDTSQARLEAFREDGWNEVARAPIHTNGFTSTFRVEDWPGERDTQVRVVYDLRTSAESVERTEYPGMVRRPPLGREPFILAALNCQNISGGDGSWTSNNFWYPHADLVSAVRSHQPDMLFFAGDQIYEGGLSGIVRSPNDVALLDYLYHWNRFLWAFGGLTRDRPTITIPDDHDVYHGNIWGESGKAATGEFSPASDNGGYIQSAEFVNAVHRTQTSHLPDPPDPAPIGQDISVYHTRVEYAGISFAVLADRMFKTAPRAFLPGAEIWNGWPQNPAFDAARQADRPGAELLGRRQESFLADWADDWSGGTWMKVALSQTLFSNLATIPVDQTSGATIPGLPNPPPGEYPPGYKLAQDFDSNAWPQRKRDLALDLMRRAFAIHVSGDQHLGSVVRYGIDTFDDGPFAFVPPAIANIWPRRWWPPNEGQNRQEGSPGYTGQFRDGFGNRMTVHAVANPVDSGRQPEALYDRVPGYGIVRLSPRERTVRYEAWPRWVNPRRPGARMYAGWPVDFGQQDNFGRERAGYLPAVDTTGRGLATVRVDDLTTGEWLYTIRPADAPFTPWVFDGGHTYRVRLGDPVEGSTESWSCVRVTEDPSATMGAPDARPGVCG